MAGWDEEQCTAALYRLPPGEPLSSVTALAAVVSEKIFGDDTSAAAAAAEAGEAAADAEAIKDAMELLNLLCVSSSPFAPSH